LAETSYTENAIALGEKMKSYDGASKAAELIEKFVKKVI